MNAFALLLLSLGFAQPRATALVPLYSYPSNQNVWAPLVQAHQGTPAIPVVAIVDVTSEGAGRRVDPNYVAGVEQLHAGGIVVLGYVATAYGRRPLVNVETDIAHWHAWYAVDGIFLDEMAAQTGHEAYYAKATAYAKSLSLQPVIGNPGTDPAQSYEPTVDALVIYEYAHYPTLQYLSGSWHSQYDRSHFGFIAYDQASLDATFDDAAEQYVLYEYVTNLRGGNPYRRLPSYFDEFLSTL